MMNRIALSWPGVFTTPSHITQMPMQRSQFQEKDIMLDLALTPQEHHHTQALRTRFLEYDVRRETENDVCDSEEHDSNVIVVTLHTQLF